MRDRERLLAPWCALPHLKLEYVRLARELPHRMHSAQREAGQRRTLRDPQELGGDGHDLVTVMVSCTVRLVQALVELRPPGEPPLAESGRVEHMQSQVPSLDNTAVPTSSLFHRG